MQDEEKKDDEDSLDDVLGETKGTFVEPEMEETMTNDDAMINDDDPRQVPVPKDDDDDDSLNAIVL